MEPKTGRKIVSKGAYVKTQGKRISLACLTVICGLMLIQFSNDAAQSAYDFLYCLRYAFYPHCALYAVGYSVLTFCFYKGMKASSRKFAKVEDVVPLTRHTAADLPAPDTLVRASDEPMQAQKAVLLRAASEGQETPPEQLVRAVQGEE